MLGNVFEYYGGISKFPFETLNISDCLGASFTLAALAAISKAIFSF
jgi:hypothetical protein